MRKTRIFIFLLALAIFATGVNEIAIAGKSGKTVQVGTLPDQRFAGDTKCEDPREYHIHAYNDDFIILRQSGFINQEKVFMFLIFGSERAIWFDTGASEASKFRALGHQKVPIEHVLELGRAHLFEILDALEAMGGKVMPVRLRDFEICKGLFNSGC